MPELPEVETVRAGLSSRIIGSRVVDISISDARSLKRHVLGPKHFVDELLGQSFLAVVRRGPVLGGSYRQFFGRGFLGLVLGRSYRQFTGRCFRGPVTVC